METLNTLDFLGVFKFALIVYQFILSFMSNGEYIDVCVGLA